MIVFADTTIDPSAVSAREQEVREIVFPQQLPSNVAELVREAQQVYALGFEWMCVVACRAVLERAVEYLSWHHGHILGMRSGSSVNQMLKRAFYLQLISEEVYKLGRHIWDEGSEANHRNYITTASAIHILTGLARVLGEIAPDLQRAPSRSAWSHPIWF